MPPDALLHAPDIARRLTERPAWQQRGAALHRELRFAGFAEAFAFMTAVALEAQALDHHPDWSNSWNRVTIDITSHAAGGITDRCFRLAEACDRHAP